MKKITLSRSLKLVIAQNWPLAVFFLAQIVIFLVVFQHYFGYASKDNPITEYTYALQMRLGQWPYRDFNVEYPPVSMLFVFIPGLISYAYSGYLWSYIVEMLIFDLLGLVLIAVLAKEMGLSRWKTLTVYTVALLAVGPIITVRFDIIPAIITLLALYSLVKGHPQIAWALLAAATFTKIYPVVLTPIFLLYQLRHQQKRQFFSGLITFVVTSLVILIPPLILSPSGLWYSFTYHLQRGLQIESIYASVLELLYGFHLIPLSFDHNFGSTNLISPIADCVAGVSFTLTLLGLLTVYLFFFRGLKNELGGKYNSQISKPAYELLLNYSILTILVFMLANKVFSPQYLIWLLPLMPFLAGRWQVLSWLLFVMVGLMTYFIYPGYYNGIEKGQLPVIVVLVLRNIALILLAGLILIARRRQTGRSTYV